MSVDPDSFELAIVDDAQDFWTVNEFGDPVPMVAAGLYEHHGEKGSVSIGRSQLYSPTDLIGTMAHEISHSLLQRRAPEEHAGEDAELLTDLTAIHSGFGVFIANSPRAWLADFGFWPGTDRPMPSYLTSAMSGYALAAVATARAERKPPWLSHLEQDALANTKAALKFLRKSRVPSSAWRPN